MRTTSISHYVAAVLFLVATSTPVIVAAQNIQPLVNTTKTGSESEKSDFNPLKQTETEEDQAISLDLSQSPRPA